MCERYDIERCKVWLEYHAFVADLKLAANVLAQAG
jgi:hypothetical protein